MKTNIKTKQELLIEEQKERRFTELFNRCMQMMNACYRRTHSVYVH